MFHLGKGFARHVMIEASERQVKSTDSDGEISLGGFPRPAFGGLWENMNSAFFALTHNWLRSTLTITGIVIGVMAIVTLVAILTGVKAEVSHQVEGLGANLVLVVPSKLNEDGQPMNPMAMMGISSLSEKDVAALKRIPGVDQISPVAIISGVVESQQGKSASAAVVGTNRQGVVMNPTPLAEGRYFAELEENQNVCVMGYKPAHDLFGDHSALGQMVRVQDKKWKVVGVMQKPSNDGTLGSQLLGLSNLVYLPFTAAKRDIPTIQVNRIAFKTNYEHPAKKMLSDFKRALLAAHDGHEDFGVITQEKGLEMVIKLVNMAQSLLVLIAAISLFVAGVGIMNIMLVTVTERTREIGIRKTVGARQSDVFMQFVIEAIILSLIGGAIGVGLSMILCALVAKFSPLTPQISAPLVAGALAVCTFVGVLFGVTPAVRAARLDPIEALRHE